MKHYTILVPLDGSAFSRQIVSRIPRLFDPATHDVILLRVAELPVGITSAPWPTSNAWALPTYITARDIERAQHPIYASQEEASARAEIERELRGEARVLEAAGFAVQIAVRFGDPAEEIVAFANAQRVDMVAMVTRGHTGLHQFVLGSVAAQVLRDVDVPVLLIRPHGMQ